MTTRWIQTTASLSQNGNGLLVQRVQEVKAITRLREVSRTSEYKSAVLAAAKSPLVLAKGVVEHPVSTISGVPQGIWKFLNRAGQGIKEKANGRQRSPYEDSNAAQLIGFAKAKRDVALKLNVDPYSGNEALQRELNGTAWAAYAGKMTVTLATAPVSGEAGLAITATNVSDTLVKTVRDLSPGDIRLRNLSSLLSMGCDRATADEFLYNNAFSPTTQTALVLHLETLVGAANRSSFVQLAAQQAGE